MNKVKHILARMGVVALIVAVFTVMLKTNSEAANTNVTLKIKTGNVTIGCTGSFDLGEVEVNSITGYLSGQFQGSDYFYVQDLAGKQAGYYTTIQSNTLTSTDGGTIDASLVAFNPETTGVNLIAGTTNPRVVVAFGTETSIGSAVTYIKRDTAANFGVVGKYGDLPILSVTVPPYQAVGTYTGLLTFTLIEN